MTTATHCPIETVLFASAVSPPTAVYFPAFFMDGLNGAKSF